GTIVALIHSAAACALMMHQNGVGSEHAQQPASPDFQTIIEIVVDDLMSLVEAADPLENEPPCQQTSARHGSDVALGQCQTEIARIVWLQVAKEVAGEPEFGQEHPGVLNGPVGIKEASADHTDFRSLDVLEQRLEPVGLDDLNVVIEEQ